MRKLSDEDAGRLMLFLTASVADLLELASRRTR